MPFTPEQQTKLNQDLPSSMVQTREQAGRQLSYIGGWVVIDTLNEIFGPGGWSYRAEPVRACEPYIVRVTPRNREPYDQVRVTYTSLCTLTIGDCTITDVGAGHGADKDLGQAIESAIKEAATDALKRCAKSLGRRMGLALYDKEQRYVTDDSAPVTTPEARKAERKAETPEATAARQDGHHPSWEQDRGRFCAELKKVANLDYDEVVPFIQWLKLAKQIGSGQNPSTITTDGRNRLLSFLAGEKGAALYAEFKLDPEIPF